MEDRNKVEYDLHMPLRWKQLTVVIWMILSAAGDVNCTHLARNRPKMYEQLARALSDFYETAKGLFVCCVNFFKMYLGSLVANGHLLYRQLGFYF